MLHVGIVVRILRTAQRRTIPQLAHDAGLNLKTISKLERGESRGTPSVLAALAHALNCPDLDAQLDEWCAKRLGTRQIKTEWRELITLWEKLTDAPESQRIVRGFLRHEVRQLQHERMQDALQRLQQLSEREREIYQLILDRARAHDDQSPDRKSRAPQDRRDDTRRAGRVRETIREHLQAPNETDGTASADLLDDDATVDDTPTRKAVGTRGK